MFKWIRVSLIERPILFTITIQVSRHEVSMSSSPHCISSMNSHMIISYWCNAKIQDWKSTKHCFKMIFRETFINLFRLYAIRISNQPCIYLNWPLSKKKSLAWSIIQLFNGIHILFTVPYSPCIPLCFPSTKSQICQKHYSTFH